MGLERVEVETESGHLLSEMVVDVSGYAPALVFLDRDEPAEKVPHVLLARAALDDFRLERCVRCRELARALRDTLLEVVLYAAQPLLISVAFGEVASDLDESCHRA